MRQNIRKQTKTRRDGMNEIKVNANKPNSIKTTMKKWRTIPPLSGIKKIHQWILLMKENAELGGETKKHEKQFVAWIECIEAHCATPLANMCTYSVYRRKDENSTYNRVVKNYFTHPSQAWPNATVMPMLYHWLHHTNERENVLLGNKYQLKSTVR